MEIIGIVLIFLIGLTSYYVYDYFWYYQHSYLILLVYLMLFILGFFAGLIGIYFNVNSFLVLITYTIGYFTPLLIYKR